MALEAEEVNEYPVSITLIEEGEIVKGGLTGPDNRALIQLANRTAWLKTKLENLSPTEPGNPTIPQLPAGAPYWSFLGVVATEAEVLAKPVEGYPDYSYVLCLGNVWAIIAGAWSNRGSFMALGTGGGTVDPEEPSNPNFPHTNFLGILSSPEQLVGFPAGIPDYSYVFIGGSVYLSLSDSWNNIGDFGGGGGGGGTPFPEAPVDGKPYARQDEEWVPVSTEAKKSKNLVDIDIIDPKVGVFYKLDNTMPTRKEITLKSGPGMTYPYEDYGLVVTLIINGIAGELVFKTENGAVLYWHKGPQPILYASRTTFIFLWTGDEWFGSTGPQIP